MFSSVVHGKKIVVKKLLTAYNGNTKMRKSTRATSRYMIRILHLSPAAFFSQICPNASPGCKASCLNFSGRGQWFKRGNKINPIHLARIAKTRFFLTEQKRFMEKLARELETVLRFAKRKGKRLAVRLNGTSDIDWESIPLTHKGRQYDNLMKLFPRITFYDYTKNLWRAEMYDLAIWPRNYNLVYSKKETDSTEDILGILENKMNVVVVFDKVPKEWLGQRIINGDLHDLRLPSIDGKGKIIGVKAKGRAKHDKTGFVVRVYNND